MFKRSSGVLMHISSLLGDYGIGTMGREAREFAKLLKEAGFSHWQILPVGPTAEYNSPYQCYSAFAGNYFFIDVEDLKEDGLLSAADIERFKHSGSPYETDFNWQKNEKRALLESAFENFKKNDILKNELSSFIEEESYWLPDYALYMALKNDFQGLPWWEWQKELKCFEDKAVAEARTRLKDEIEYECFCQYIFFKQWYALKAYVNDLGIGIIGDMPIYVAQDSADAWSRSELFEFNEDRSMKRVAGVPPDYFSEDGQLWGNPLYDWDSMRKNGYEWWLKRVETALTMFDSMRIDHFRGFVQYWAVPADSTTAKTGKWVKGPGADLFDRINSNFKDASIIAEDLGDITDDVREFVDYTGYSGMKVMQFAFLGDDDNLHLPHNYERNFVAYTGTHDNNTLLGWMWEATPEQRERALYYCGFYGSDWGDGGAKSLSCKAFMRTLFASCADLAIIPIQDICGFGGDTRINKPGIAEGNWSFRITKEALGRIDVSEIRRMNYAFKRI